MLEIEIRSLYKVFSIKEIEDLNGEARHLPGVSHVRPVRTSSRWTCHRDSGRLGGRWDRACGEEGHDLLYSEKGVMRDEIPYV